MHGFLSINFDTPTELVPFGYANAEFSSAEGSATFTGDDKEWEEEIPDDHKDICCEDDYDDEEEDDEDEEREWCD